MGRIMTNLMLEEIWGVDVVTSETKELIESMSARVKDEKTY
jgi:hypothetical protein